MRPNSLAGKQTPPLHPIYDLVDDDHVCLCSGGKANDGTFGEEEAGPDTVEGFTRGDHTMEVDDAAEVDDEVVNDEEEEKSQEPEDGEDLDERIDE